jgi:uncharacterized protein
MELNANYSFDAPIEQVWNLLMDPEAVGKCLPGSRGLREIAPDRYEVELGLTVAAIAGNFKGTVSIAEKNAPHSYKLGVEGSGRHGMVQGYALISLEPAGSGTEVRVAAQAHVGGLIARVGQRLLEGIARTTMDRFYGCLANSLSQRSV